MNPVKFLLCCIRGHEVGETIVNTLNRNNWIRRCERCGVYLMHGDPGTILLSQRAAYKTRDEFYEAFPYMRNAELFKEKFGEPSNNLSKPFKGGVNND